MKIKLINKAGYHSKIENQNGNYIDIDNFNYTKSNFKKRMLISKKSRDFYYRTKFIESYKK